MATPSIRLRDGGDGVLPFGRPGEMPLLMKASGFLQLLPHNVRDGRAGVLVCLARFEVSVMVRSDNV